MTAERSRFGPYELVSRLGAGGMAETFLAVRRGPGSFEQQVCLKRILPAFEQDAEFVRLFLEEARIAATLRHANVVQVLDFGVTEGSHFMALELVDGLDLRALLRTLRKRGESMTSGLVSHLAYEISNALEYAHRVDATGQVRGVVHRDISPSNVLLSTAGGVKLADFGIAKAMDKTHVTRSGSTKGKVPYMAPEYALAAEYDARSDLFSLGVTLYECLVGERPFDGATELDTMRRIQDGEHTPLSERLPTAPTALVDAIERLIMPDKNARFANAAALQDALVDVAPPPTARRILGELVRGAQRTRDEEMGKESGEVAYADTALATPDGTMVVDESDDEDGHVVPAGADVATRTAHRAADSGGDDATSLDASAEEARRVADAPTHALDARSATPIDTARRPEPPDKRGAGRLAIGAVLVLGALAVVWVSMNGGDEPDAVVATTSTTPITAAVAEADPADTPGREGHGEASPDPIPTGIEAPPPAPEEPDPEVVADTPTETETATMAPAGPTGLKIGVLPWGEVFVDGRSRGNAPVEVELRPGSHLVRVVGPGGREDEQRVRVTSGRMREVQIRLR